MNIEKAIEELKEYVELDEIYISYKQTPNAIKSDFDEFCIEHCEAIENVLADRERLQEKNTELKDYMIEYLIPKSTIELLYVSKNKIREIISKLENEICGSDLYLGEKQSMKLDLLRKVEEELLESEE